MTKKTIRFATLAAALLFGAATVLPAATSAYAQTPAATAPAKAMPKKHMAKKSGSATVKSAQDALNKNGASLSVDGKYGPKTKAAIKAFQSSHGLKANGHLDKATKKALGVG